MQTLTDLHSPSWVFGPYNNNRTAWRGISFPAILVVPDCRDLQGNPLPNSQAFNVQVLIENVPQFAPVAGQDHVGLFVPNTALFAQSISQADLSHRLLDLTGAQFQRPDPNNPGNNLVFSIEDAQNGDFFVYTTTSGVTDTYQYLSTANYYDLSDVVIETLTLPPMRYQLGYRADYYVRDTWDGGLLCINPSQTATAVTRITINHPGNVLEAMYRATPSVDITSNVGGQDGKLSDTVAFYRPFADALQDIMDEQWFLGRINWVNKIVPQYIPYLSYLLGFKMPYFPQSMDNLRRAVLKNAVKLQRLKGSRRAIAELFTLFGYNILISNLWWSVDGELLIQPGAALPPEYVNQEIGLQVVQQLDPLLANYADNGFGQLTIPLLFRPQDAIIVDGVNGSFVDETETPDITISSYLVEVGGEAYNQLTALLESMNSNPTGQFTLPDVDQDSTVASSVVVIKGGKLPVDVTSSADAPYFPPVVAKGVSFDPINNVVNVTFNGGIDFSATSPLGAQTSLQLFTFASYARLEVVVPAVLEKLQSNKFNIQILTRDGQEVTSDILEPLIDFIFQLKAFHSILNVIIFTHEDTETYEVTDFSCGGNTAQRSDTDAGKLQVPPAIIPTSEDVCADPVTLGYKPADLLLRSRKLTNLVEEQAAWKSLDGTPSATGARLAPANGDQTRGACVHNVDGQDRVTSARVDVLGVETGPGPNASGELSPVKSVADGVYAATGPQTCSNRNTGEFGQMQRDYTAARTPLCTLDGFTDYSYRGRVGDETLTLRELRLVESVRQTGGAVRMGSGTYYTFPTPSTVAMPGHPNRFSGGATAVGQQPFLGQPQGQYLQADLLSASQDSFLGRLLRSYGVPTTQTIHYTDAAYLDSVGQANYLAIQRPALDIELPISQFPGCRFLTMDKLESDYTSSFWQAKPWDDAYSMPCFGADASCPGYPSFLGATLVDDGQGGQELVFPEQDYLVYGNGCVPDIATWGQMDNGQFPAKDLVQTIRTNVPNSSYVQLDGLDYVSYSTFTTPDPLFSSAAACGTGDSLDAVDGYPSITGAVHFSLEPDLWGLQEELQDALGTEPPVSGLTSYFLFSTGVLVGSGVRYDGGCLSYNCGGHQMVLSCVADLYIEQDGFHDWNADKLDIFPVLDPEERVGCHSGYYDGSIPSFFELSGS